MDPDDDEEMYGVPVGRYNNALGQIASLIQGL